MRKGLQPGMLELSRHGIIQNRYNWKKYQKLRRMKQHVSPSFPDSYAIIAYHFAIFNSVLQNMLYFLTFKLPVLHIIHLKRR